MNEYYYIKAKAINYGEDDYYLCLGNYFNSAPTTLKIFDSIESAVDWKFNLFDEEAFRSIFPNHEISIERI